MRLDMSTRAVTDQTGWAYITAVMSYSYLMPAPRQIERNLHDCQFDSPLDDNYNPLTSRREMEQDGRCPWTARNSISSTSFSPRFP